MFFLILSNANIQFNTKNITLKSYNITKILFITRQIELIKKQKFVKVSLDKNSKIFVVYIVVFETSKLVILLSQAFYQLFCNKTRILFRFLSNTQNRLSFFSQDLAIELPKNTNINKYAIKFIESKQPSYRFIYNVSLVELETLKIYIKTRLKTGFNQLFKILINLFIFFDMKLNQSLQLYIHY